MKIRYFFILLFVPCQLWASAEWTIYIDMTVVQPQCVVNNNKVITVAFDEVQVEKIDGQAYKKQPVPLDITCPGKSTADVNLQISGQTANFNVGDQLLQTTNPDLGIKMLANNRGLPINTWLPFTWPNQVPELAAVLVRNEGVKLPGGTFSAGATINLSYN
ncbi:fimbrial protein [Erwiniaceae bacterium CAU 1747]